jgi:hypothetical protein
MLMRLRTQGLPWIHARESHEFALLSMQFDSPRANEMPLLAKPNSDQTNERKQSTATTPLENFPSPIAALQFFNKEHGVWCNLS